VGPGKYEVEAKKRITGPVTEYKAPHEHSDKVKVIVKEKHGK
jgi:hypothetical protein